MTSFTRLTDYGCATLHLCAVAAYGIPELRAFYLGNRDLVEREATVVQVDSFSERIFAKGLNVLANLDELLVLILWLRNRLRTRLYTDHQHNSRYHAQAGRSALRDLAHAAFCRAPHLRNHSIVSCGDVRRLN